MARRRTAALGLAAGLALVGCSTSGGAQVAVPGAGGVDAPTTVAPATDPVATDPATTPAPTPAPTTTDPPPTTEPPAPTSTAPPETVAPTTTIEQGADGLFDPACVMEIQAGDTLNLIAERFDDETVTAANLVVENDIADPDVINEGDLLDVCVDNGLDDITGTERLADDEADEVDDDDPEVIAIKAQQRKLNELFAGFGMRDLLVDGISGPVTRQRLCAARLGLGLPVSREPMIPGSEEEEVLLSAPFMTVPFTSALNSERWVLIDQTCQVMFAGEALDRLVFVFPTSTGEAGHETRPQDRSPAFRYDPAADNGGWHNSTTFPVAIDNPLNGNMYKPIYFDGGQAIHGSNNVPTSPQSKGCARLRVEDQDALVGWLGLADLAAPSWSAGRINVTVNVQGAYTPD